jgi:hypothetical protein
MTKRLTPQQEARLADAAARRIQSDLRTTLVHRREDAPIADVLPINVFEHLQAELAAGERDLAARLAEEGLTPDHDWLMVEYARTAEGWRDAARTYHWMPALAPHEQAKLVEFFQSEIANLVNTLIERALDLRRRETAWANSRLREWVRNRRRLAFPVNEELPISEEVADLLYGPDEPVGGHIQHGVVVEETELGDGLTLHRITYPTPQEDER